MATIRKEGFSDAVAVKFITHQNRAKDSNLACNKVMRECYQHVLPIKAS